MSRFLSGEFDGASFRVGRFSQMPQQWRTIEQALYLLFQRYGYYRSG